MSYHSGGVAVVYLETGHGFNNGHNRLDGITVNHCSVLLTLVFRVAVFMYDPENGKKKKKHAALIKMYIDGSVTVRLAVNTHLSCVRYFFNMDYKCNPLNPDKQIFFQNDSPCSLPLSVCHLILVFSAFFSAKKDTDERGRTEPKQSSNTFGCQKAKHFQAEEQLFLLSKHSRHLFY